MRIVFVFISQVYRARLYTLFDRIFDLDWCVMEGGGAQSCVSPGPRKGLTHVNWLSLVMSVKVNSWEINCMFILDMCGSSIIYSK